jgi:amino acid transporter
MSVATRDSDVETLHQLGYAQELLRRMGGFSNFAVSFTIISILSGCLTLYYLGMTNGGPAVITIGWPVVGVMVTLVGLAMAEVCSSYPTAGGLYYWSAKLGGKSSAGWSWMTGWFNLLGQVAITAGIDFGLAFFVNYEVSTFVSSWPSPLNAATDFNARLAIVVIYAIVLFIHGLMNTFGIRLVALLNDISVWWHIIGVLVIVGVLFLFSSPVATVCLHPLREPDRFRVRGRLHLCLSDGPTARPVHLHRL